MRRLLGNKPLLIMFIAIVLLAVLAFATSGERTATWAESTVGAIVQPVQSFASKISGSIIGFTQRVFSTTDADKENEQLKVRLAQLEQVQTEAEELKQENQRLKGLLGYVESDAQGKFITARVIGKSPGVWFDVFTINAGRNHGIREDMPVLCSEGLIGRVTDVAATYAKVTAIIDTRSSVSAMVQRTRDNGMVSGILSTTDDNLLELYYLPAGSDLVPGDVIVTNGIGGIFPKGVAIGTVTEVTRQAEGSAIERNAIVKPAVDFTHIEEVLVQVEQAVDMEVQP